MFDGPDLGEVARTAGLSRASKSVESIAGAPADGSPISVSRRASRTSQACPTPYPARAQTGTEDFGSGRIGRDRRRLPRHLPPVRARADGISSAAPMPSCSIPMSPYATLQPGDRLRLVPTESRRPALARPTSRRAPQVRARRTRLVVEEPGLLTTLQDGGRMDVGHLGVPRAGAADSDSMRLANLIAGNPELSGVLETTLEGPASAVRHGGACGRDRRRGGYRRTVGPTWRGRRRFPPAARLKVGKSSGLQGYLAVSGGDPRHRAVRELLVGPSLRISGPGPLQAGDELGDRATQVIPAVTPTSFREDSTVADSARPSSCGPRLVEDVGGSAFSGESGQQPDRSHGSNGSQTGTSSVNCHEVSHGMVHGAVQMPPSGEPIVLLCDHATMGGYPVIATVISADIGASAQRRPGDSVQFEFVDLDEALAARAPPSTANWLGPSPGSTRRARSRKAPSNCGSAREQPRLQRRARSE